MAMSTGEKLLESTDLVVGLLNLFKGRDRGVMRTASTESSVPKRQIITELVERVINELGWGVRDEGLFPLKVGKLPEPERATIMALIEEHDKKLIAFANPLASTHIYSCHLALPTQHLALIGHF